MTEAPNSLGFRSKSAKCLSVVVPLRQAPAKTEQFRHAARAWPAWRWFCTARLHGSGQLDHARSKFGALEESPIHVLGKLRNPEQATDPPNSAPKITSPGVPRCLTCTFVPSSAFNRRKTSPVCTSCSPPVIDRYGFRGKLLAVITTKSRSRAVLFIALVKIFRVQLGLTVRRSVCFQCPVHRSRLSHQCLEPTFGTSEP